MPASVLHIYALHPPPPSLESASSDLRSPLPLTPAHPFPCSPLPPNPSLDPNLVSSMPRLAMQERAQLQLENEALRHELEYMVEQTRAAESSMLEISSLSHAFASKVEQQSQDIDMLFEEAEQTSENVVRGNQYLDSAAKHSRDFRIMALTFLIVASFALLFLDWYYD